MDIETALPSTCNVQIPNPSVNPQDVIRPRWSDTLVSVPYAVVTPTTTSDITATIEFAVKHGLKVVPAGGGRGCFVPITRKVIYLDLKHFDSIELDDENNTVRMGGGCMSGDLIKTLAKKGYYTAIPNSNGVGMTGALLGGLSHPFAGFHGIGIDMVKSFTIVPFSSPSGAPLGPITVSIDSTGEEKNLFNTLRGAGHGLGIVTETTLATHPIASLNLDNSDKVWQRTLVFPPPALATAIDTYLTLQETVPKQMNFFLGFLRAPPSAPRPGAPVVLLSISFFGPSAAAENVTAITFSPSVLEKTVSATTMLTPLGDINNALDPMNKPGGLKELHGAFVRSITPSSLARAFDLFISFTEGKPERYGLSIIFPASNTTQSENFASSGGFYNARDRGIYVQVKTSYPSKEEKSEADRFAKDVHDVAREEDRREGRRDRGFANNFVEGSGVEDVYTEEQIKEIERVKGLWDEKGLGWCPTVEGW